MKTYNQNTVLPNCQVYQDTASVCQHNYSTSNILEQRTTEGQDAEGSLQKYSIQTRLGASEPMNTNNTGPQCCESQESADNSGHENSNETDKSKNSETKETT